MNGTRRGRNTDEPTAAELAAIEREWPIIAAGLAVVDAEIAILLSDSGVSPLDLRRLRNAEATFEALSRPRPARRTRRARRTA